MSTTPEEAIRLARQFIARNDGVEQVLQLDDLDVATCIDTLIHYFDTTYSQGFPQRGDDEELDDIYDLLNIVAVPTPDDGYAEAQWAKERFYAPDGRYLW